MQKLRDINHLLNIKKPYFGLKTLKQEFYPKNHLR